MPPRQKKRPTNILHLPVQKLMASLHEQNPRIHGWDEDLPKLVRSLLFSGWCELPSYNQSNDRVIGGHGRVMACEWLIQQPQNWFHEQWQDYLQVNPQASDKERERFSPGYWLKIPVKASEMDDDLHKTMMVRLNNPESRGHSKDEMKTLILSRLNPVQQDIALPDPERRAKLLAGVAQRQEERQPQQQQEVEERQAQTERVTEALSNFEAREDSEYQTVESEAEGGILASDFPSADAEPDVGEGGAHFCEDPKPNEKKQVMYPLAIVLSDRRYQQFQQWKEAKGITTDQVAFLKGHRVFNPVPVLQGFP